MGSWDSAQLRAEVVLGQWCRTLFSGLVSAGVRHVVISPGSRSTPLVMQALREKDLACHAVLDERSAGFFALGLASAGGPPPLLICTSGTAMAHYFPAVIEARMAGLPLLLLSADRPAELQECGAAQTIAQDQLLAPYAKSAPALGAMSTQPEALRSLLRKAVQAVALSQGPLPGPVHMNFPVAKPLEIEDAESAEEIGFVQGVDQLLRQIPRLPPRVLAAPEADQLARLVADLVSDRKRTCVTLGPGSGDEAKMAAAFARLIGAPLLSELPGAQGAAAPLDVLCHHWHHGASAFVAPERVIHLGAPCISANWLRFIESSEAELWCVPGPEWKDPSNRASRMILGDVAATLALACAQIPQPLPASFPEIEGQVARCQHARHAALGALGSTSDQVLPEVVACRTLLESVPANSNVLLGNSLSVRLAAWLELGESKGSTYFVQRGANGIDGQLARSSGLALGTGKPTLAVLGDVTAAHDLGSLLLARTMRVPLVIAVLDNDGGRLFDHLPLAKKHANQTDYRFWTTPPQINWRAAAQTYGVAFESCVDVEQIRAAVQRGFTHQGASLLHLPVDSESTHVFLAECRKLALGSS